MWRTYGGAQHRLAVPISTMEFSHPLSQLHCIKSFMHLSSSLYWWLAGYLPPLLPTPTNADVAAWLLQMFKVSLFIIYAATVLDFG